MMTPPTDTTPETPCPAILVVEIRQASGVRIAGRLEVSCYRGHHPAGTPHHGAADDTGELVKWRAEPLPETDPQLADPAPARDPATRSDGRLDRPTPPARPDPLPNPVEPGTRPARKPRKRTGTS